MLRGHETNAFYDECLRRGLCKDHLKELEVNDEDERSKLQRKAMLFIRLQIFGPLLFDKPYSFEKMKILFSRCRFFPTKDSPEFQEAVFILDSVVVYTLCYLSSVCCAGALYQSGNTRNLDDPEKQKIIELLTKNILHEDDISYFTPLFNKAFPDLDTNIVKISFVSVLLHVRNLTITMKLDQALKRIDTDLLNVSKESEKWKMIGNDAFKESRYEEAVQAYTSAINFNPYSVNLLKKRAQAYTSLKSYPKATLDYYLAIVIDPTTVKTFAQLCYCLFVENMHTDSLFMAELAMEKFPDMKETEPDTYLNLKVIRDASEEFLRGNKFNQEVTEMKDGIATPEEEEDVPDLIEASDSDSEMQDFDAEDGKKVRKSPKRRSLENSEHTKPKEPVFKDAKEEKCYKLNLLLKEGSGQLLNGLSQRAIPCFHEALSELKIYPEVYNYQECDIMSIRYAYGCALCKSKDYDELLKSISVFKDIIEEHTAIIFPTAYYGMALAYKKLNLYKEALNCLSLIPEILSKNAPLKVCNWPGLSVAIEETKPTHLMTVTADLIKECENAPPPDAICRYDKCSLRSAIYHTDPDFKGYYSTKCTEQCFLQYHIPCWKILKSQKQYTDKAFLEQECFTPDCEGVICNIVCISKDGEVEKTFSVADTKNLPKQKKLKSPRKPELKEEKKRRRKDSSGKHPEENSVDNLSETEEKRKGSITETHDIPLNPSKLQPEAMASSPPLEQNDDLTESSTQLSVMAEPFIMLKKEKLEEDLPSKVPLKSKEHKKAKNTLSLDEFLESNQATNSGIADCAFSQSKTSLQNGYCSDYPALDFSSKSQTDGAITSNGVSLFYEPPLEISVIESTKKLIFDSMKNLLQKHGPLHVDDPLVTSELCRYPHAANRVIADAGGIGELLKHNLNFAVVGDAYICVVSDVIAAYERHSADSHKLAAKPLLRYSSYNPNGEDYRLNPNAKEYRFSSKEIVSDAAAQKGGGAEVWENGFQSPKIPLGHSVFDHAGQKIRCPQQVSDLLAKLTACLTLYGSEEFLQFQPYIEESLKPFSIVKVQPKACAAVQTEKQEEAALKYKEEIDKLQNHIHDLTNDKEALKEEVLSLQEKYEDAVNSQMECTNEVADYRMKIQNLTKSLISQKTAFEEEQDALMKENKMLSDKFKISEAKEKGYKCQIEKFVKDVKSLQQQSDELAKSWSETQNVVHEKDHQIDTLIEKIKTFTKETEELKGRAIYAEDLLLHMKKNETLKRINTRLAEATMRYKTVEDTMKTLALGFRRDVELLAAQLRKYIIWLGELGKKFTAQMDEQINLVINGTPLSSLKPVDIPSLGEIPNLPFPQMPPPGPMMNPAGMLPPNMRMPPEILNNLLGTAASGLPKGLQPQQQRAQLSANSALPTTTSDLILRVQGQLTGHPIAKPVAIRPDQPPPEEAKPPVAESIPMSASADVSDKFADQTTKDYPLVGASSSQEKAVIKQESSTSLRTKSNPKLDEVGKSVRIPISQTLPKMEEPATKLRGAVSQTLPKVEEPAKQIQRTASQSNPKIDEVGKVIKGGVSQENLRPEPKNSYEKLLHRLRAKFPQYTQPQLVGFVKEFREKRAGKLSGLSMEMIINDVSLLIESREAKKAADTANKSKQVKTVAATLVNRNLAEAKSKQPLPPAEEKKCPWAGTSSLKTWNGESAEEDCSICHEDMSRSGYKVECGHRFHRECIKAWLAKKSDCPICRVHLLLPEDYPALS